jgi:transcriptional regulator with XRE-family HTH domain
VLRRYERTKVPEGTLGTAFRERRWFRGLEQHDAAAEISVSVATYRNWEVNRSVPTVKHIPRAIEFLGFDWRDSGETFGERLRAVRTRRGLSIRAAAVEIGVDPATLRRCETNIGTLSRSVKERIESWIRA